MATGIARLRVPSSSSDVLEQQRGSAAGLFMQRSAISAISRSRAHRLRDPDQLAQAASISSMNSRRLSRAMACIRRDPACAARRRRPERRVRDVAKSRRLRAAGASSGGAGKARLDSGKSGIGSPMFRDHVGRSPAARAGNRRGTARRSCGCGGVAISSITNARPARARGPLPRARRRGSTRFRIPNRPSRHRTPRRRNGSSSASAPTGAARAVLRRPSRSIGATKSAPMTRPRNPGCRARVAARSSVPAQRSR